MKSNITYKEVSQADIEMLARNLLPAIQKFFETDESKREFEEWKSHTKKK